MSVLEDKVGPNKMSFTLKDGNTPFQFPVNPEEVNISRSKGYETVNMLEHGEFDFAQGEKMKEITFSSFFPKRFDPSYCMNEKSFLDPRVAMNLLNTFLISKKPLRFIISETGVNVPVFIVSLNSSFRGGETGDIYFDLTLRTWRDSKVEKVGSAASGSKSGSRTDLKKPARPTLSNLVTPCPKLQSWSWVAVPNGTRSTSSTQRSSGVIRTGSSPGKSW